MPITEFNKDLIESIYPEAYCIPTSLIWKLEDKNFNKFPSLCQSGDYFAQIKKDGYFYQFEKHKNKNYLFSRNISKTTGLLTEKLDNVPHINNALNNIPDETVLIGEIYYPGKTSKDVTKIMGCLPEKAISRQKDNLIHFYLHDIIYFKGINLINTPAIDRYNILVKIWNEYNLSQYSFLELANIYFDDIENLLSKILDQGEEGLVLKKKTSIYTPGKRPAWETIKIKKTDYADAFIIGFEDATKEYIGTELELWPYWIERTEMNSNGEYSWDKREVGSCYYDYESNPHLFKPVTKGYYYGWKTSIKIGAYNNQNEIEEIGSISSGLTDELKTAFAQNPQNYLFKVVKLKGMEKDCKEHTLRHFVFKGFHPDKNPEECLIDDIFANKD